MAGLKAGGKAPPFTLPISGGTVSLSDFKGKKLVVYFYPRADTPGCTREAMDFTRLLPRFKRAGTAVLGVSADPVKAQERFAAKHKIKLPLGSDETHEMLTAYGAWGEKMLYGRKFLGVIRMTVLIDPKGRVAQIWPKVKVEGHVDEVLEAAQSL